MATATVTTDSARDHAVTRSEIDWRTRYFNAFCGVVLAVFAAIWLLPLLWAVVTSLRPEGEIATAPTSWWTSHWTLDAYRSVFGQADMTDWYVNSAVTAALTALVTVVVCSMAGFALSQTRFAGRRAVYPLLALGMLIPSEAITLPMFREFEGMRLLNTYWALVLPAVAVPAMVLVFTVFFSGLPSELADSARADGASWFRVYRQIYMPLSKPVISAVVIFTFVASWNNFLWPFLVMTNTKMMTIPVGLSAVASSFGIRYAQIMASAILGALPLLIVFLLFQRRIVEGIATTGINK
jgi:multiple sugar transport system permease protein